MAPPAGTKGNQLEGASVGRVKEQKQDGGCRLLVCTGSTPLPLPRDRGPPMINIIFINTIFVIVLL